MPIYLFEKNKILGKKLLATGNGRCNIHNLYTRTSCYQSSSFTSQAIQSILEGFNFSEFQECCRKMGLLLTQQLDGRVYPNSQSAKSLLEVFSLKLEEGKVRIHLEEEVLNIHKDSKNFFVQSTKGTYQSSYLILACGSEAYPKLGGSNKGLELARSLGLEIVQTYPSLVPLKLDTHSLRDLSGMKLKVKITLKVDTITKKEVIDDLLFTSYGVSGFGILDISSQIQTSQDNVLIIDFLPNFEAEFLEQMLLKLHKSFPQRSLLQLLNGFLPPKFARVCMEVLKIKQCHTKNIKKLIFCLKNWEFKNPKLQGFENAEVSGGGVSANAVKINTLESKAVSGLYIIGEMLDIVGDRGGYNLAFAWASARVCAESLKRSHKT